MWIPCGFQVDNTWIQMWTLHNFHVKTTLFPCEHHTVSTWTPCSFYAHYIVTMWILCGFHVHTMWFPGGHHLVSRWTTHGFKSGYYVVSTGHHMVFTWMPCGVHMDTMCCWGNHMETSTKNSSAWSQLASLFKLQWTYLVCHWSKLVRKINVGNRTYMVCWHICKEASDCWHVIFSQTGLAFGRNKVNRLKGLSVPQIFSLWFNITRHTIQWNHPLVFLPNLLIITSQPQLRVPSWLVLSARISA